MSLKFVDTICRMPATFVPDKFSDLSNIVTQQGTPGIIVSNTPNTKPLIGVMSITTQQTATFVIISEKTMIQCKNTRKLYFMN